MRIWLKWIGSVILIPVVLILLLSILLYIPSFQNMAIKKVTDYAGKATGMIIGVEKVRLSFPLNVTVHGVEVVTLTADTILTLRSLTTSVRLIPLFKKQLYVDAFEVKEMQLNTGQLINGLVIQGKVKHLAALAEPILLTDERAVIKSLQLSDGFINLRIDSMAQDTTSAPLNWVFLLEEATLNRISFAMQMPADSLHLATTINRAKLTNVVVSLPESRYSAAHFMLTESSVNYDTDSLLPAEGFDPSHLALSNLNASIDSLSYCDKDIYAQIVSLSANERSGLEINTLTGTIQSDSVCIEIPELVLKTAYSDIRLLATVPWASFAEQPKGNMRTLFTASVGKEDVLTIVGGLSTAFKKVYPDKPMLLTAGLEGNLSSLSLSQVKAELPGAFKINMSGRMQKVIDPIARAGTLKMEAQTGQLNFLLDLLPAADRTRYHIPSDLKFEGKVDLNNQEYQTRLHLSEGAGSAAFAGRYNLRTEAYQANLRVDSLEPVHFLPTDSLLFLTAVAQMEGQGLDIFSAKTWSTLQAHVTDIRYGISSVSHISLDASLKENQAKAEFKSNYPIAQMNVTFDGTINKDQLKGMLIANVDSLDLYELHLLDKPMATSFQLFSEMESNLKKDHKMDVTVGNWNISLPDQQYNPKTLTLLARSNSDTTQVSLHAGDLSVVLTGNADLEAMTDKFMAISKDIDRQLAQDSTLNFTTLRPLLPEMQLAIQAQKDNPVYNILKENNVIFDKLYLQASISPEEGLTMDAGVIALYRDTFLIDMINFAVRSDSLGLTYVGDVVKSRFRNQEAFTVSMQGVLQDRYADAEFFYSNEKEQTGLQFGFRAYKEPVGIRLKLYPNQFVLGFTEFNLNPDNYILIKNLKDIDANIRLTGPENASLWIHSLSNEGSLPEVHAELNQINLGILSKYTTYLPALKGLLNADFQYAPSEETFMAVADMNVDNLIYENGRVGEMMLNAVYLPLNDTDHQVDIHLYHDRKEITTATAFYRSGVRKDSIAGSLHVTNLPMTMLTPFIPERMAELNGLLNADVTMYGDPATPKINGSLKLDTASVYVGTVTSRYRLDEKQVEIKDNLLSFKKFNIYASGQNPFVINGTIDLKNPFAMTANLRMSANNLQLLDVKRNKEGLIYGKMLVNAASTLTGPLSELTVRGEIQLLGKTDITYVLRETPLTVEDRLKELVTFTVFADTLPDFGRRRTALPLGGMDVSMIIRIDPVVKLKADISPDQSSYVDLTGGGDLSFKYSRQGEMTLTGRYNLSGGRIKYALPIIPMKEFTITKDSYVEWTGDLMNPILNMKATERLRTSVTIAGQNARPVNFDVGINLKERLESMSMQFTIDAVDNSDIQNELSSLPSEERSKRAVTMLVTGMYLGSQNATSSAPNMGGALNSFLESEINNIAGSALKNVDLSVGIDDNAEAGTGKNYSFRFAKRFYKDRIRVVLGGRVNTDNTYNSESFIDNLSVEIMLDESGSRYLKVFYDRNYESLLEGEVIETGTGIVLRKKMLRIKDLFNFKKKKVIPVTIEAAHEDIE